MGACSARVLALQRLRLPLEHRATGEVPGDAGTPRVALMLAQRSRCCVWLGFVRAKYLMSSDASGSPGLEVAPGYRDGTGRAYQEIRGTARRLPGNGLPVPSDGPSKSASIHLPCRRLRREGAEPEKRLIEDAGDANIVRRPSGV